MRCIAQNGETSQLETISVINILNQFISKSVNDRLKSHGKNISDYLKIILGDDLMLQEEYKRQCDQGNSFHTSLRYDEINMLLSLVVFSLSWMMNFSLTIYDTIESDTEFHYRELSAFPSKLATIKYNITYNYTAALLQCSLCYPRFEIYTTLDDSNFQNNCSSDVYGQLRNENLHTPLKLRSKPYRFTNCALDSKDTDIIHCNGKITIQDYIPRNYGFSFGYRCEQPTKGSLKGLTHNVSIYEQTNETKCLSMGPIQMETYTRHCADLYHKMTLPNLIGDPDWNYILD